MGLLVEAATRRTVLRVWLVVLFLGATTWLVVGGRPGEEAPTPWAPGTIAPRAVFAPQELTISIEAPGTGGRTMGRAVTVQPHELIVSEGQRVTPEQAAILRAFAERARQGAGRRAAEAWGLGVLAWLIGGAGFLAIWMAAPPAISRTATVALLGLLELLAIGIARGLAASGVLPVWAVPVAGVGMVAALLLNPAAALVTTVTASLLIGLLAGQQLAVTLCALAGGMVGVVMVRGARRRSHLLRAGAWSGAAQGVAIIAAQLAGHAGWAEALREGALDGAVSGFASFVLTITVLPLLENAFGLITDITLLELSDLNHPLLKELSHKAPGTYHHSLIVATVAEAGCEAIGANGLLARVGCYFHDIGKMPKAEYFVENQPPGRSRHDALSPSMSSLIIVNHVKEGIELARAHKLNQAIIDFIPGHHGTGVIYYFYRRALEQVEDERLLKEEQFRYPGPRPQTRETAVALLADSSEAACRALPEHTPAKLSGMVRRIINNKFIDGQLDECDLTLRDLERIAEAFMRVLTGIYHQRVPYPAPPGEDVEDSELYAGPDSRLAASSGAPPPRPPGGAAGPRGA